MVLSSQKVNYIKEEIIHDADYKFTFIASILFILFPTKNKGLGAKSKAIRKKGVFSLLFAHLFLYL